MLFKGKIEGKRNQYFIFMWSKLKTRREGKGGRTG
jgi:hypothetical protein